MLTRLASVWPAILTVAAVVAGITSYWIQVLKIRELNHKIWELQQKRSKEEQLVHIPTDDEISRYGKRLLNTSLISSLLFLFLSGLAISGLLFSRREVSVLELKLEDSQREVSRLNAVLGKTTCPISELHIELNHAEIPVSDSSILIRGLVSCRSIAQDGTDLSQVLDDHSAALVTLIRRASIPDWWVQRDKPKLLSNGEFRGEVFVPGNYSARDQEFEIVVLVVPKYSLMEDKVLTTLPFHYAESNHVRIRRFR